MVEYSISLSDDERLDWLQLARTKGIGPTQFFKLLETCGDCRAVLRWLSQPETLARCRIDRLARRQDVEDELRATLDLDGQIIAHGEEAFPDLLRQIPDPPAVITVLGSVEMLHRACVAVVGARNASGSGRKLARDLARRTADQGQTIVSGLARGIDTAAHEGGLEGEAGTIAVIAAGVDIAYPDENRELMARVAETGCVVSERALGAPPLARHFPQRNRIISGLSRAVVVVEAAEKSGSLMTARLAGEHGREVMAVPGSPLDPRHRGTNRLIREGAQMVESVEDILSALPAHGPTKPLKMASVASRPRRASATRTVPIATAAVLPKNAEPVERQVEACLGPVPLAVDELIRQCHASAAEVSEALLSLELEGRLTRHPGNRVSLDQI